MTDLFENLMKTYAQTPIATPHLKDVTLAQWALQSNFGASPLASQHNNFGGLKFRARINRDRHLADPIDVDTGDGVETFCAFASIVDFLRGYWAFIENGDHYKGWDAYAESPWEYIAHLHRRGYSEDRKYVSKVMNLVPRIHALEAKIALGDVHRAARPPKRQTAGNEGDPS